MTALIVIVLVVLAVAAALMSNRDQTRLRP
jgi:uncharacterized membrane protein